MSEPLVDDDADYAGFYDEDYDVDGHDRNGVVDGFGIVHSDAEVGL